MLRMAVYVFAALLFTSLSVQADLHLAPGTKIVFGDNSELSTAPEPGGDIPAGHGGTNNTVSGSNAYVGGGTLNSASNSYASVGAGFGNSASGQYGTIGGGQLNGALGTHATVGGGQSNSATGIASTVPGGANNTASGNYSFAAGRRAKSTAAGTMTLADSTDDDFTNSIANSLRIRATGGFFLFTKLVGGVETFQVNTEGHALLTGTLFQESDRNKKENFGSVDTRDVLELLASLPIETYNYRGEDPANVHLGVMAQDFNAAFGLGGEPGFIAVVDAQGVAFAGIQALYDMVMERDERIEELESALDGVLTRLDALEGRGGR